MKNFSIQNVLFGALGIFSLMALILCINFINTKEPDPLVEILSQVYENENLTADFITNTTNQYLTADFITDTINQYSGPTTASIEICRDAIQVEEHIGKIMVSYNENTNIQQSIEEIRNEINPILGHAIKNNELNWEWNENTREYTFYSALGDESFWKCYFTKDTEFFKEFLVSESVSIPGEIPYLDTTIINISSEPFITSSSEGNRNISIPSSEAFQNGAFLGFLNIKSPKDKIYSHSFFNKVDEMQQEIELSPDSTPLSSTMEIMRNNNYPFISLHVVSTQEEQRVKAVKAVNNITIKKILSPIKTYRINLNFDDTIPADVEYNIEINSQFLFPFDNSDILFIGSHNGPKVIITEPYSYTPYPPTPTYNPTPLPLPDDMFNDLLEIANKTNRHLCTVEERESIDFMYTGALVEQCGTTLRILPPQGTADIPTFYYPEDGEYFFCGGYQITGSSSDPRCLTVPQTCQTGSYALCPNN